MKIKISPLLGGAKSARGTAVIIDVISASSTIVSCLHFGARSVMPVGSMDEAFKIKRFADLVCGEIKGFSNRPDFYNSPYSAYKINLKGKRVIIQTDAGTKGILSAKRAEEVFIGCFLNSSVLAKHLENKKLVTLVPMGDYGETNCIEDDLLAEYLAALLEGDRQDFQKIKSQIKKGSVRNILRNMFMRNHLESCLQLNTTRIVPVFEKGQLIPALGQNNL